MQCLLTNENFSDLIQLWNHDFGVVDWLGCYLWWQVITNSVILQYDAFEIGFITTDDFTNADIMEATYPAVAKRLHSDWISDPAIPVVTGFLGKVFLAG